MYSLTRSSNKKFVKKTIYQLKLSNIRANYVYGCGFSSINAPSVHNNINGSLTTKPIHQTGLSVLRVNSAGQVDSLYITVDKFLREKMMHARDLLALGVTHSNGTGTGIYNKHQDMEETHNNRPLLLPRANSLIASFGNIRTIIYKDHVLIIDPGSTAGSLHSDHIRIFAESLSRSIFVKNEHKYQQARDIRDRSGLGQDSEHMDTDAYSSFKYKSVSDRNTNTVGTTTSYSHGRDDGHLTNGLESSYNSNSNIQSKSKEDIERNSEYEFEAPFELHVLEELLKNMCETYDRRMVLYRPLGHSLLKQVELSDTIEGIHKLLPLSDALYEFELSIKEAQHCLLDILDDEEELSDLLLSDYHRTRGSDSNGSAQTKILSKGEWKKDGIENNHSHNNHHSKRWDVPSKGSSPDLEQLVDEIKILLESYTLRLNNSLNDVLLLQKKVKNRQSLTDLSMQVQRNRLLSLNLNLGVAAVCLGASTAMSGWFGMNLLSGLEENALAFPSVVVISTTVAGLTYIYTRRYVNSNAYYKYVEQKHMKERMLLKSIFTDIHSVDSAVRKAFMQMDDPAGTGAIKKVDFMNILTNNPLWSSSKDTGSGKQMGSASSTRTKHRNALDAAVAETLFDLLDSDTDGELRRSYDAEPPLNNNTRSMRDRHV